MLGIFSTMAPKLKKQQRTPKKGLKTKNKKKAQPWPDPASSEDGVVTDKSDPILRDIMNAIGTLSAHVCATEQRIETASTSMADMLQPAASEIRVSNDGSLGYTFWILLSVLCPPFVYMFICFHLLMFTL